MKILLAVTFLSGLIFLGYRCVYNQGVENEYAYVGTETCGSCHTKELNAFKLSDHYHAMDTLSKVTVKGNFNNSSFVYNGDTAFFYKRDSFYYVKTVDTAGLMKEFKIKYTFGWYPLQQYLVQLSKGRIQVLPFCWDAREKEKGGQRWFHLYNKERIAPDDELFWMGINQNWNYMCADCHTTDFKKNFSLTEDKFNSTWKESRVSCESCHGPGSGHISWAKTKNKSTLYKGFSISLAAKQVTWTYSASKGMLMPQTIIKHDTLIETCARCHARATRFTDRYKHGESFLQSHIPSTLDTINYYIDGQIKQEDYEYGSFLQSKMYAAGVTCTHCHDAHTMKIKSAGNKLCTSCHSENKYDVYEHSRHKTGGEGASCTGCHMPVTTYMVIDNRLDHSMRIPRPDQSLLTKAPNACNKCHKDKSVQWAAQQFQGMYGKKIISQKNYASLMYDISRYVKESSPSLQELLQSNQYPAIVKATALEQYGSFTQPEIFQIVLEELKNKDSYMRLNALKALRNYPPDNVQGHIEQLLYDKVITVRIEALNLAAPLYKRLSEEDAKQFTKVKNEYLSQQEQMSHRPEGFFNRALFWSTINENLQAEALYKESIKRFPKFVPSYTNLFELLRLKGNEAEVRKWIDTGLQRNPKSSYMHYALGLWFVRNKDNMNGMVELEQAVKLEPSNVQMAYGYAIGLFSTGKRRQAIDLLESFTGKYGNHAQVLEALASMYSDIGNAGKAEEYKKKNSEVLGY